MNDASLKRYKVDLLQASETRYRGLFEDSPISLWEEDFSQVKIRIDGLRQQGVVDIQTYLETHPDFVKECVATIQVIDINKATLGLWCQQQRGAAHQPGKNFTSQRARILSGRAGAYCQRRQAI